MLRTVKAALSGFVDHGLNRANAPMQIVDNEDGYTAFGYATKETVERLPMRLLASCVMPNLCYLVVRPCSHGDL